VPHEEARRGLAALRDRVRARTQRSEPDALGLQCLWDEKAIERHHDELLDLADKHPGSWLAYFATEIAYRGEEHGGIEKKYRPRGYDEGPKKE